MEEGQSLDESKYNPSTEYAMYWGIVLERLAAELSEIFAYIKEPIGTKHKHCCLDVLYCSGLVRFLPDQFLPCYAKPELHKINDHSVIILMGMDCWKAFEPSAMAFCFHLGSKLIEKLRVPENELKDTRFDETRSSVTFQFQWKPIYPKEESSLARALAEGRDIFRRDWSGMIQDRMSHESESLSSDEM